MQITNYQCPSCTGPLKFAGESGKLACEHCGNSFDVDLIEQFYADKEQATAEVRPQWDFTSTGRGWTDEEAAKLRAYSCPSCGAELICDDTTAATSCPYCGNPGVVAGQFAGQLRPDYVIPFKLDKADAIDALKRYYKDKRFLPDRFSAENHIEEIKGVYVPFWLFNGKADASMRFRGTIIHTHRRGDYEVTVTEHYRVVREGSVAFERVPADGSSKMPDAHMDSVEPYNYADLKDFSTAYLPGYLADKYDLDAAACAERVNRRIKNSTVSSFTASAGGYYTLMPEHTDIRLRQGDIKYALLPVWMLCTRWKEQSFLFAMNGQTGKLIGDLPVDKGKLWRTFAMVSLTGMLILSLILFAVFPAFSADMPLIADQAGLLTASERTELDALAEEISARYACEVIVVTSTDMAGNSDAMEHAMDIYEQYNFGYGPEKSGLMLFLSMAERDYALVAHGYGNTAFTDRGKDLLLDNKVLPLLAKNDYGEAFKAYLEAAEDYLETARNGEPYDTGNEPEGFGDFMFKLGIVILLPVAVAGITCGVWRAQMKTVKPAKSATRYIPAEGFVLTRREDRFMFRTETRRRIETSSGRGGGTSINSRGFSGRSGKF